MIQFQRVTKAYPEGSVILRDIDLSIEQGEFVSLVGPSGAGKSTLLRMIYAEDFPTEGDVTFYGRSTRAVKQRLLPYYRRNFGTVFQDYKLLPNRTAYENVAFTLEVDGRTNEEIAAEVPNVLALMRLENKGHLYPKQLSGGECQRVSMARALIHGPKVLIADEPTGNLDPASSLEIIDLLLKINELGTTVLLATHSKQIVDSIRRRVVALEDGRLVRDDAKGKYDA